MPIRSPLVALLLLLVSAPAFPEATPTRAPTLLLPGEKVERELTPGAEHAFRVAPGGRSVRLVVEQHGIDVEIEVLGETESFVADGPFDRRFAVAVLLEANEFVLRGREVGAPEGSYVLRLEELETDSALAAARAAARAETAAAKLYPRGTADAWRQALGHHRRAESAWREAGNEAEAVRHLYARAVLHRLADEPRAALEAAGEARAAFRRLSDPASEAYAHNELGLGHWRLGDLDEARASFHRTLSLADVYGDRYLLAAASANLCLMHLARGEILRGRTCYEDALPLIEAARAPQTESAARTNLGRIAERLGETAQALEHYGRSLEIHARTGDRKGRARTLNNLGVLLRASGDFDGAMAHYAEALAIFDELGLRRWQARSLANVGRAYQVVDDAERAGTAFRRALELFRQTGDERGEADILENLAGLDIARGRPEAALPRLRRSLEIRHRRGERIAEAITLRRLGAVYSALGEPEKATEHLHEAVALSTRLGDRAERADAAGALGRIYLELGKHDAARQALTEALELASATGRAYLRALSLAALAEVELAAGFHERAEERILRAIEEFETVRASIGSREMRTSYSEFLSRAYGLRVRLLMRAHREVPGAGHAERALEVAERLRSRAFLELLREAEIHLETETDPELGESFRRLSRTLQAKTRSLVEAEPESEVAALLESEQLSLLHRLEVIEAEIRRRHPAYGSLTRPPQLDAAEIRGLADSETALAFYLLGEPESYLWLVTREEIRAFVLPARSRIETLVQRVVERWSRPGGGLGAEALKLAEMLKVEELAKGKRVGVVADGGLHLLPFAALPVASPSLREPARPLGAGTEVVSIPSAAVLALKRQTDEAGDTKASPARYAVLADPRFAPGHPALPGSRHEAQAILDIVGRERVLMALGEAATPALVTGNRLHGYDVIHFATHGLVDTENPAVSGLLLSPASDDLEDADSGFLSLHDIYQLQLDAELVALSGCRTALGPSVRGEGLLGLVRGFMHAGSERVLASLWQVDDRATAELIPELYRRLEEEGATFATALAGAQRQVFERRRYRDPHYWAGFVLVGDWK